jgi:hypothetical protein
MIDYDVYQFYAIGFCFVYVVYDWLRFTLGSSFFFVWETTYLTLFFEARYTQLNLFLDFWVVIIEW